ncbi:ribosomal protein S6--L-glutamate ligase [Streptomyces sp. 1114.5]|uniref:ATP-grasp domain-containing protein n=1 Tax=Streptomyces sp. 1114.5 TaxID=1938830 RepID=UPI000EABBEBA|nr:alpha-L-glutamate ligase [Streptomyces sp. 1114.5]RKT17913.1 ribosomal protein S6--L-glutamate ligase [Streptomyces sp. 1114.5]
MRIGLISGNPGHPVLAAAAALLVRRGHEVVAVPPAGPAGELPDACLLKARTPQALVLAAELERQGVPVVNSAAATELCQDRVRMAELARAAGLPFAETVDGGRLGELADPAYPFVVKSRHSRRHDLVARVDGPARLRELAEHWPEEPVVTQPFVPGTGWDQKLWVIDGQVFSARRRSELATGTETSGQAEDWEPPPGRAELALRVGEVFGLDVYGVDLLDGPAEPVIVDVNAFPGVRGRPGAPEALAALALRVAAERGVGHRVGRVVGRVVGQGAGQGVGPFARSGGPGR